MPAPLLPKLDRLLYGGDYNPEQWPEEIWAEDAQLMREAGVNLVTIGVFSWALLESEDGRYDFAWLDRVIEALWAQGVSVDLATPSAAPPAWLVRAHPEILPVTREGVRLEFGSRQHFCPSSEAYRAAAVRMATQLAKRYGAHPALALWHVSNEYSCHVASCYCETSAAHFRRWLQERYKTLGALNDGWGTAFWGQRYSDWEQIEPPRLTPTSPNPSQVLDWHRFSSDALFECFEAEAAVLREQTPEIPLTTNFMNFWGALDHWKWSRAEDVVTLDSYPDPGDPEAHVGAALNYDLMRGFAAGRPWLLLEHAPSAVNWRPVNVPKRPGLARLWVHQAIAHGSDGALFFQWRQARGGSEKFHSALVPHAEREGRVWRQTVELGAELGRLAEVAGTVPPPAEVAFLLDYESWWALDGNSHPSSLLELPALLQAWYGVLHARGIQVDFVHPQGDLEGRRLVVAPNLHLVSDETLARLTAYVEGGGELLLGPFSAVVDEHDRIRRGPAAAALRRLLGAWVDEPWPLQPGREVRVRLAAGECAAQLWTEWLELDGAEAVGTYGDGPLAGRPAVTRNPLGSGTATYCSALLDRPGLALLLGEACARAGVEPLLAVPAGVEVTRRTAGDRSYLFVLNHTDDEVEVKLPTEGLTDLLGAPTNPLRLGPLGVAVLREP